MKSGGGRSLESPAKFSCKDSMKRNQRWQRRMPLLKAYAEYLVFSIYRKKIIETRY